FCVYAKLIDCWLTLIELTLNVTPRLIVCAEPFTTAPTVTAPRYCPLLSFEGSAVTTSASGVAPATVLTLSQGGVVAICCVVEIETPTVPLDEVMLTVCVTGPLPAWAEKASEV